MTATGFLRMQNIHAAPNLHVALISDANDVVIAVGGFLTDEDCDTALDMMYNLLVHFGICLPPPGEAIKHYTRQELFEAMGLDVSLLEDDTPPTDLQHKTPLN